MGARISCPQKEVYFQVKSILIGENFRFSKGDLKRFIHWLLKCFPSLSRHSVLTTGFWDAVGFKLFEAQGKGDLSVVKFSRCFML